MEAIDEKSDGEMPAPPLEASYLGIVAKETARHARPATSPGKTAGDIRPQSAPLPSLPSLPTSPNLPRSAVWPPAQISKRPSATASDQATLPTVEKPVTPIALPDPRKVTVATSASILPPFGNTSSNSSFGPLKKHRPNNGMPEGAGKNVEKKFPERGEKSGVSPSAKAFALPLDGDLVLIIREKEISKRDLKVIVQLQPYPKTKHDKAMSKVESQNVTKLVPKSAVINTDTVQAVIELAEDGIYEFKGKARSGEGFEGECLLTITGTHQKKKVKPLGTRKIGGDATIVKIMMPEGILWEDETEFNGSIEDADSITKYNSDSGLVWKGYKQ